MRQLTIEQQSKLREAVAAARATVGIEEAVERVYADFQAELNARRPRCDQSGRCCRFDEYGHLLFITTAELAVFVSRLAHRPPVPHWVDELRRLQVMTDDHRTPAGAGCRYQIANQCSVHTLRPFGCRVFFCDPTSTDWQQAQYDLFHARLRKLHDDLNLEYFYVEWRQALNAVLLESDLSL